MSIPDNADLYDKYDREMERLRRQLPECCHCGEPIQQERAVRIDGNWYCDDCLSDYFREVVEEVFG
jgi:formylmethanofuran dehydrogenase subunit E